MSGRHRRPEADSLPAVDVAEEMEAGPVIDTSTAESPPTSLTSSASGMSGSTVVARRNRAAERAARRSAARRRWLIGIAGVLALALVVTGGWLLLRDDDTTAETTASTSHKQRTTLIQLTGADGTAAASALVGTTEADDEAVSVLLPSQLLVDVAGAGDMPFGEAVTLEDPTASTSALTDLLGVSVKDSWVLSPAGLAALVDSVGGVQAAVDRDVVVTDAKGNQTVVVNAGNQKLDGKSAAAYATFLAEGEPEQARLARFDDVLTGVVAELPEDRAALVTALAGLGAGSRTNLDSTALAERLGVMRKSAAEGSLVADVLPVKELDTGDTVTAFALDAGQAAASMRSLFPGAIQKDAAGESLRVLVENGVGTPGLVEQARAALVDDGFRFLNGGNASEFGLANSLVLVPDGTSQSVARGRRVAESLGLPASAVQPSDRGQTVADVIVILGKDFAP
jgi:anionic cell wall polymer biosynthesis LytR-Cps2A-Psr (LCP) family protein